MRVFSGSSSSVGSGGDGKQKSMVNWWIAINIAAAVAVLGGELDQQKSPLPTQPKMPQTT
jgi:hypothetical protein